ncbi:hypothetical protein GGTG_00399 [Gaeumannomyces tritici R3-111a-1]|uniref:Pentatricopeptide repeat protein n=1 Tax=Gaeumannomyces tritici (strain R3-111a-1) TaxID=644352 RepID=J3NGK9_GAET3|nr:hypothetical protein GGTG_00399 [Gaeumannomyces tritici R3-111a-1]EJT80399.1 hypothetical protein GGTG_00399 [Gaeumannomyces tritici R3-111a-1]
MSAWGTWRQASCWFRALSTIPGGPLPLSWSAPRTRPNGYISPYSTSTAAPASSSVPPLPPEDNGVGCTTTDAEPLVNRAETAVPAANTPAPTNRPSIKPPLAERLLMAPMPAHPARVSVLIEPWKPLPVLTESYRRAHEHVRSVVSQRRYEERRQSFDRPFADWRELLQRMFDNTPDRASWKAVCLQADAERFDKRILFNDLELGIRPIMESTGCAIRTKKVKGSIMSISVYGPPRSLERAVAAILETTRLALVTRGHDDSTTIGMEPHELSAEDRSHLNKADAQDHFDLNSLMALDGSPSVTPTTVTRTSFLTAQDVPRPQAWTKRGLDDYVARITDVRLEELARGIPGWRTHHVSAVSALLLDVFHSHDARASITLQATHKALRYHVRHGMALRQEMMILFDLITNTLGLTPSTETFNIILGGYAQAKDLWGFECMVRSMEAHSCMPNFRTWLYMMSMIESGQVRQYILGIMRSKGMLGSPSVARELARLNAVHHARVAMETEPPTSLREFLDYQDQLYGERKLWLTLSVANQTIDVFCQYGRFQEAFALVKRMRKADRPAQEHPDIITYTTILGHAKTQRLVRVGLLALERLERARLVPNEITYHLLFEMLWKARLPLAVGVVWHYAALTLGSMSYRMRRRVGDVLHALAHEEPTAEGGGVVARWARLRSLASLVSALPSPETLPRPDGDGREPLDILFAQEYAGYKPESSLSQLLKSALEADWQHHREFAAGGSDAATPQRRTIDLVLRRTPTVPATKAPKSTETIVLTADYSSLGGRRQSTHVL